MWFIDKVVIEDQIWNNEVHGELLKGPLQGEKTSELSLASDDFLPVQVTIEVDSKHLEGLRSGPVLLAEGDVVMQLETVLNKLLEWEVPVKCIYQQINKRGVVVVDWRNAWRNNKGHFLQLCIIGPLHLPVL